LLKAFFSHDFHLGESEAGNTAFYDPHLSGELNRGSAQSPIYSRRVPAHDPLS